MEGQDLQRIRPDLLRVVSSRFAYIVALITVAGTLLGCEPIRIENLQTADTDEQKKEIANRTNIPSWAESFYRYLLSPKIFNLRFTSYSAPEENQIATFAENKNIDAIDAIIDLFRTYQVIGLGESHTEFGVDSVANELIERGIKQGKVDFIALEGFLVKEQDFLDQYFSGKVTYEEFKSLFGQRALVLGLQRIDFEGLKELKEGYNFDILFVDNNESWQYRDFLMKERIREYLEAHPDAKGFFYGGGAHSIESISWNWVRGGFYPVQIIGPTEKNPLIMTSDDRASTLYQAYIEAFNNGGEFQAVFIPEMQKTQLTELISFSLETENGPYPVNYLGGILTITPEESLICIAAQSSFRFSDQLENFFPGKKISEICNLEGK